jgi:hypothetical protein
MATANTSARLANLRVGVAAGVWLLGLVVLWPHPLSPGWPGWLLAGAVMWQAPLAMLLLPSSPKRPLWWDLQPFAGFGVLMAFYLPAGMGAGLCTLPWLAMTATLLARPPALWAADRLAAAAWVYLVIGAAGLSGERFGLAILGFEAPWVLMVGVHFHFAGFVMLVLLHRLRPGRVLAAHAIAGMAVLPLAIIAARHAPDGGARLTAQIAEAAAAMLLAGIGLVIAWRQARHARREMRGLARAFMLISSLALLASMPLAMLHGLRPTGWLDALTLPWMWALHGSLNALVALPLALLAWRRTPENRP